MEEDDKINNDFMNVEAMLEVTPIVNENSVKRKTNLDITNNLKKTKSENIAIEKEVNDEQLSPLNLETRCIENKNVINENENMGIKSCNSFTEDDNSINNMLPDPSNKEELEVCNDRSSNISLMNVQTIQDKLREMDEISVKPISKSDPITNKVKEEDNEISLEIKKKSQDRHETEDSRRITNLRKNIRDVMDENQLDATTLAAQRQESERLARVQEQQKIIRELQKQMATERQNNRTQNRVLSILQGQTSLLKTSINENIVTDSAKEMYVVKGIGSEVTLKDANFVDMEKISSGNLTPSVSIAPIRRAKEPEIPEDIIDKKDVVTIVDSSSDDDCIVLSDDEEIEDTEDDPHNSGLHVNDAYNIPDEEGRVVINIGHPEGETDIFVAPQIARIIKPHQIGGVRFLFDNIIESVERFDKSTGFGCILAHSMGLGKTLQVVCFCDVFLRHTTSKWILCIMPINTLQNWVSEFNMWLPEESKSTTPGIHGEIRPRQFKLFVLNDQQKTLNARAKVILQWKKEGGVLLIGYELFRLLSLKMTNKKKRGKKFTPEKEPKVESDKNKQLIEDIYSALVKPGPDLVICDEGHRIKNSHASISLALKQIKSKRRIVLTGYPLQNNLLEYWCMVDFVRPNYLGSRTEFSNMFERPIQNGQCIDSTPQDIKLMRYRAHVLHSLLVGFVQRRSHVVLHNSLPQKEEYVILVRMTAFQRKLYNVFMNEVVRTKAVPNPLKAFAVCCKIWNHPDVLYNFLKKREADLDLEIEEVEGDTDTTNSICSRGKKKHNFKKPKEVDKSEKTILSAEVSPNQANTPIETTDIAQIGENITGNARKELTENKDHTAETIKTVPQQYCYPNYDMYSNDNFYTPFNSYQQNHFENMNYLYPSNVTNEVWPSTSKLYEYNNVQHNPLDLFAHVEPSYANLRPQATETFDLSQPPSDEKKSSEIVDLDTKEIKTIETHVNMISTKNERKDEKKDGKNELNDDLNVNDRNVRTKQEDGIPYEWAVDLMKGYIPDLIESSPKMVIFFQLLEESLKLGDRILVFSQSLLTLNLIERFLQKNQVPGHNKYWTKNSTYFRLDGSTSAMDREKLINEFNTNPDIHLFLVSTRAGSLGINLVGANRVIVFDASWNPCHDTQAVCRVYRYGQKKPCFIYRLVMDNCLEKKIYDRQVSKQGMSDRVVDECNPDAHLSIKEVTNLCYDNEEETDVKDLCLCKEKYLDIVIQNVIGEHDKLLSKEPFHHESLLVDRKEKKLSQAEKRLAKRGYELEKRAANKPAYIYHATGAQYRVMRSADGIIVHRPVASVRPMQSEANDKTIIPKVSAMRQTRWIPAEIWQNQGMSAQEMTLPLDVVIPTNAGDKSNIVLKAGQKVMVLKSPKGIYMQLESGKIIAIKTSSLKTNHNKDKTDISENSFNHPLIKDDMKISSKTESFSDIVKGNILDKSFVPKSKEINISPSIFLSPSRHGIQDHKIRSRDLYLQEKNRLEQNRRPYNSTGTMKLWPSDQNKLSRRVSNDYAHERTLLDEKKSFDFDEVVMMHETEDRNNRTPTQKSFKEFSGLTKQPFSNILENKVGIVPSFSSERNVERVKNNNYTSFTPTITIDDDSDSNSITKGSKTSLLRKQRPHNLKNAQSTPGQVKNASLTTKPTSDFSTCYKKGHMDNMIERKNSNCQEVSYDTTEKSSQNTKPNTALKMPTIKNIPAPYPSVFVPQDHGNLASLTESDNPIDTNSTLTRPNIMNHAANSDTQKNEICDNANKSLTNKKTEESPSNDQRSLNLNNNTIDLTPMENNQRTNELHSNANFIPLTESYQYNANNETNYDYSTITQSNYPSYYPSNIYQPTNSTPSYHYPPNPITTQVNYHHGSYQNNFDHNAFINGQHKPPNYSQTIPNIPPAQSQYQYPNFLPSQASPQNSDHYNNMYYPYPSYTPQQGQWHQ